MTSFSVSSVYAQLTSFANLSNFWSLFNTAFGSSYDLATAASFRSQWQRQDFSLFPQIEVVSSDVLGSAKGAYAISTNRIYLSDQFVSRASQQSLDAVILEEFGHFVDAQVNQTDTAGDEGELFSVVVRGVSLSAAELNRIKAEDDHEIMSLGGQFITIEKAAPTILTVTTTADQNNGVTTDGLSLREAILIANANPNTDYEIQLTGGLTYNLTANGINEDAGKTGDLDITSRNNVLYIVSVGTQKATINASTLLNGDRVVHVRNGGKLSLQNVVITGGLSNNNGGGILVDSTSFLDLYNTRVANNQGANGGGIYNLGITQLSNGSTVNNNSGSGSVPFGGGIYNDGNLTAIDSTISNNNGYIGGGIYNGGTQILINTTVSGNTADQGGGIGTFVSGSSNALLNTTVSGNKKGGGIANDSGIFTIINSTVTNNTVSEGYSYFGGGISNFNNGTVNLRNTVVAGNFDSNHSGGLYPDLSGTFNGDNNNLIGSLTGALGTVGTGTDIVNPNFGLGSLQNNGGLTLTHALLPGSPAIDAGNNNLVPVDSEDLDGDGDTTEQLPFDARNLARISGGTVDIGAVEVQNSVILPSITLAVAPASVLEDGIPNLVYTFTRTGATTNALTVNYGITGTATNGIDYATIGTSVTFAANSATATLTIDPTADTVIEANETVALTLATGTSYTIGTATAVTGTIQNDDLPSITLAVSPASVLENGTTNLVYTFTRTGPTTNALIVNYGITGTADATDYTGATPGTGKTITFAAGLATATLTIDPTADTTIEANETVALTLATGTSYTIGTATAVTGTIQNDDLPTITLAVAPVSVLEDGTTNLVYTFTRTGATTSALTVNYGITGTADATDYTGATPGTGKTITFAAGSATATLTIDPTADTTIEANETVALTLATGTGYTIGTATDVTGTITNDDFPTITLAIAPASVLEDGTPNLIYTFTRTGPITNTLTVNYGITGTATNGTDYATIGTSVTFAANSATATVTVNPTPDTVIEANETVALTLATGTGYTIGTTTAVTGTITDDDSPNITLAVAPASVLENGTPNLVYTFTRTGATTSALTVNYSIGGTATNGTDYTTIGTSVTFAAGSTTATVTVDPTADTIIEDNETVALTLATGTGYTIGTTTAVTGTITNDDFPSTSISINDITVVEGKDLTAPLTLSISSPSPQTITVNYTITAVDATANLDYTTSTGTLTFAANSTTATLSIPILNDNFNEEDESFFVTLSNPVNATLNPDANIGEVIITDTLQSSLTRTLTANVENLKLIGTAAINGTGNAGNNLLTGNSGNNILTGLAGNDTYSFLANTILGTDTITETTTGGTDTLNFSGTNNQVRLNLGSITNQTVVTGNLILKLSAVDVIENVIGGNSGDRLTGNSLSNSLEGNGGNDNLSGGNGADTLTGGIGDDILTGGAGNDNFAYVTGKTFTTSDIGLDTLTDFTPTADKLILSKTTFSALTSIVGHGFSQATNFAVVEDDFLVETSNAFIVYSSNSGSLFYNQNGNVAGLGTGAEFAVLISNPILNSNDFILVA